MAKFSNKWEQDWSPAPDGVNSKHFFDQGLMYSKGQFKDVLFYKEDVLKHVERKYHPGE